MADGPAAPGSAPAASDKGMTTYGMIAPAVPGGRKNMAPAKKTPAKKKAPAKKAPAKFPMKGMRKRP